MKRKVSALIDEKLMRLVERRALEEGRPLRALLEDALRRYLEHHEPAPEEREQAFQLFSQHPLKLSEKQFRQALEEDTWQS
jgi:phage terminase small subunit